MKSSVELALMARGARNITITKEPGWTTVEYHHGNAVCCHSWRDGERPAFT